MNKFDELIKELESKPLTGLSAEDQELIREVFTRKAQESENTEAPAVQVGYVYKGKLVDLGRPNLGNIKEMSEDCDQMASIFTIALSNVMYAIHNVGGEEEANKYRDYVLESLRKAVDDRKAELVKKFLEMLEKQQEEEKNVKTTQA